MLEPVDPMLGGLTVEEWFLVFQGTHTSNGNGGFARTEWPEDGGFADQPVVVVTLLPIVGEHIAKEMQTQWAQSTT